ncbi:hypothetical protein DPMN_133461, partial [Dreissena polymorpha]
MRAGWLAGWQAGWRNKLNKCLNVILADFEIGLPLQRCMYLEHRKKALANSIDPDETPHDAVSHQGLCCLLKGIS